eukprot:SAG25_NODE_482_length_7499_cov_12.630946_9_plen_185_part_00
MLMVVIVCRCWTCERWRQRRRCRRGARGRPRGQRGTKGWRRSWAAARPWAQGFASCRARWGWAMVAVRRFCACIGSPYLRQCVHGASIGHRVRPSPVVAALAAAAQGPRPRPRPRTSDGVASRRSSVGSWQGGAPTLSTPTRRWPSLGSRRMSADSLMTPTPATCDHWSAASADWSAALSSPEV